MVTKVLKFIIVSAAILFNSMFCCAQSYVEAEKAYNDGDYGKAIEIMNSIADKEGVSAQLYYDLGNMYYSNGDLGKARLFFERSYRLDPTNKEIKNNLKYLEGKIADSNRALSKGKKVSLSQDQNSFFESLNNAITVERTSDYWSAFAVISFLLTLSFLALYLFTTNVAARKVGFFSSGIFLFFAVIFIVFSFMSADSFYKHDDAVILEYSLNLKSEPSENSEIVATPLTRGTKVRVISSENNDNDGSEWYKVRYNSDFTGWVKSREIEII